MTARADDHLGWAEPATPPGTALLLEVAEALPQFPLLGGFLRSNAKACPDLEAARSLVYLALSNQSLRSLPAALRARLEGAA